MWSYHFGLFFNFTGCGQIVDNVLTYPVSLIKIIAGFADDK